MKPPLLEGVWAVSAYVILSVLPGVQIVGMEGVGESRSLLSLSFFSFRGKFRAFPDLRYAWVNLYENEGSGLSPSLFKILP